MLLVAKHSMGLNKNSLIYETASLLGFRRVDPKIMKSLSDVYQKAVESSKIAIDNEHVIYKD